MNAPSLNPTMRIQKNWQEQDHSMKSPCPAPLQEKVTATIRNLATHHEGTVSRRRQRADGSKHYYVRSRDGNREVERIQERDHGDAVELTHLFARIHEWRHRCARSSTRLRIPQDNAPLGLRRGLGGDLFSDLSLLLLLLGVELVRERASAEVSAGGGAVVVVSGGGGQVEGGGGGRG